MCKNKFIKVEREQEEKHLRPHLSPGLTTEEVELSDNVTHLETEPKYVTNKISLIDDTLEEMKMEIESLKKTVDDQKEEKADLRKQCKFDNKGYFRESKNSFNISIHWYIS